jgi:hypothetical protein
MALDRKGSDIHDLLSEVEQCVSSIKRMSRLLREPTPHFRSTKLPSNLPEWRHNATATKSDCLKYLNQLEDAFVAEEFPEVEGPNQSKRWVKALLRVVITDEERSWVKAHIVKPGLNWAQAKLKFCQGFTRVVNFLAAAQELSDLRQTNKAVTIHSERFEDHLKEALIVPGEGESVPFDTAQREPIYSLTYLRSLNKKLGQAVMSDRRIREVTDNEEDRRGIGCRRIFNR